MCNPTTNPSEVNAEWAATSESAATDPAKKIRCGPQRTCCRGWLATVLASMCMAQIVLATGVWIKPYAWWQFSSRFSAPDQRGQVRFEIENGQFTYYAVLPDARLASAR